MKKLIALSGSFFVSLFSFAQVNKTDTKSKTVQKVKPTDVNANANTPMANDNQYKLTQKDLQHKDLQHKDLQHKYLQHKGLQQKELQQKELQQKELQQKQMQQKLTQKVVQKKSAS